MWATCIGSPTLTSAGATLTTVTSGNIGKLPMCSLRCSVEDRPSPLEAATDDIARSTTNAQTQTDLVLWKVGGIGSVRRAALRTSPTLALVDLWAYCRQMTDFFENGTGAILFGGAQARPLAISRAMETGIVEVARATRPAARFREMDKFVAD